MIEKSGARWSARIGAGTGHDPEKLIAASGRIVLKSEGALSR
jgi:hypothetical protein